ncbi:MAG: EamA family transporter, partial [Candidatus Puniceispirillaceae bacterium]
MDLSHILSLAAALSWTLASLFGHQPSVILGSLHFNRIRMVVSAGLLCIMMLVTGNSWTLPDGFWLPILASALIGVVIGDFFLFVTMRRLGPRRTGILFAANAPLAAMLGWLFLSEPLSILKILAVLIGFCGICLAIIYGKRRDLLHVWETVTQPLWIGVGAGLIAALGQA